MRADQLLVERGLAASRSQAVRLIAGGMRWRDAGSTDAWRSVAKNRDEVPESAELELDDARKVLRLVDLLENSDDVQDVYYNAEIPEEAYEAEG